MSSARRALVLDSGDEISAHMVDVFANNGYIVHVIVREDNAERYLDKPVYIHVMKHGEEGLGEELEKVVGEVELALLLSLDENLNISLGRALRSRGVPIVVVLVRSSDSEDFVRAEGMIPVNIAKITIEELIGVLKLRFAKIIPVDGSLSVLSLSIASDSKLLGKTLSEIEDSYEVKALIIREGRSIRDPEAMIQEGDTVIAIGNAEDLKELASQ